MSQSPRLRKSKDREQRRKSKEKRETLLDALVGLQEKEEALFRAEHEYLATKENEIQALVEQEYNEALAKFEEDKQVSKEAANEIVQTRKAAALQTIREAFPLILSNPGAKQVQKEDVIVNVDKYKITRRHVANGTYSAVYYGEDPRGFEVAVKVTPLKSLPRDIREKFLNSLKIRGFLKDHRHSGILPIYAIYQTPEKLYTFCHIMKIDLLKKIKKDGPFPDDYAFKIGKQVADGLAFLHSRGIAHQRIKPGHILLDEFDTAKICCFGFCVQYLDTSVESPKIIGQEGKRHQKYHHFFSPEVTRDGE